LQTALTPQFKIRVDSKQSHVRLSPPKLCEIYKKEPKIVSVQTALLRSLKRQGDRVEREYRFVNKKTIKEEDEKLQKLTETLKKLEEKKEEKPKGKTKKICENCLDLLVRGLGTDGCRKHKGKSKNKIY